MKNTFRYYAQHLKVTYQCNICGTWILMLYFSGVLGICLYNRQTFWFQNCLTVNYTDKIYLHLGII